MPVFSFSKYCKMVFQSDCTNLYSKQQRVRVSGAPYPCQYLALAIYCIFSQTGGRRSNISSLFSFPCWLIRLRIFLPTYLHLDVCFCEASFQVFGPLFYWILSLYYFS